MSAPKSGQALLELCFATLLIGVCALGAALLFKSQWDRFRCVHRVFEVTHARLVGQPLLSSKNPVLLEEGQEGVVGTGVCGGAREAVSLRYLEFHAR